MLLPFLALSLSLAANPACTGKLSGAVTGSFECDASMPSYVPGSFEVTGLLRPGTYTLDQLGGGRASVAAENRTLYTATKTTGQKGQVTLILKTVEEDPTRKGAYRVHGSYRARLLPAGGGKSGEVIVEVEF
jgi:hypothetical protein